MLSATLTVIFGSIFSYNSLQNPGVAWKKGRNKLASIQEEIITESILAHTRINWVAYHINK